MARKPLLLGMLLGALTVAVWFVVRPGSKGTAPAQTPSNAQVSSAPESVLDQPETSSGTTRAPTAPSPSVTEQPPVEKSATAYAVRGKVVDARRFSVRGVEVRLVRSDGTTATTLSDDQGRFEFRVASRSEKNQGAALWAVRGEEAAVQRVTLTGTRPSSPAPRIMLYNPPPLGDVDAGTLALQPACSLNVHALQSRTAVAGADVRVRMSAEMFVLWHAVTDASGAATSPPIPGGFVNVEVMNADAEGRARAFLPEEHDVHIQLTPRYDAQITLVEKGSGAPIAGASVQLDESVRVPSAQDNARGMGLGESMATQPVGAAQTTDAEGVTRFPGLSASADYTLRITAPGFERSRPGSGERLSGAKPDVRVTLQRVATRTVQWPIEAGEVPAPQDGARIVLRPAPGSSRGMYDEAPEPEREGVVREGRIVAEAIAGNGYSLGTAPDGSIASFWVDDKSDLGRAVSFRKPRTIDVIVRDAAGAPVAGASTMARNQGNNPLGLPVRTDDQGHARLTGLYGDLANVYVLGPAATGREMPAGNVDLKKGDGKVEVVIPSNASMRARLSVRLDGVPQLPPQFQARCTDGCKVVEEVPERGELVLELGVPLAGEAIDVNLSAVGFLAAKVSVPVVRDGSEAQATANLTRGSTLTVRVALPANKDRVAVAIWKWDESKQAFGIAQGLNSQGLSTPNGPNGSFRFFMLEPARYQAVETNSKITSEPVEIMPGQYTAAVDLDLAGVEWVSGRVEVPDAADLLRVKVLNPSALAGASTNWMPGMQPPDGTNVGKDGTFRVRVKSGVKTRLRAWHPWLAPADPDGAIDVDGGRDGVVLKLVAGDSVRLAVPQLVEMRGFTGAARVAVYDGPVKGEPRASLYAPLVDGVLRFTDVPRGRVTLWIDAGVEYAPLVLRDVEIAAGVTDLGTAKFTRGSSLRIKLAVKEGQAPPRIYVSAQRKTAPTLDRQLNSDGSAEVVLSGLEAGSYLVHCGQIMAQGGGLADRTMEFDGVNDVELAFDLR